MNTCKKIMYLLIVFLICSAILFAYKNIEQITMVGLIVPDKRNVVVSNFLNTASYTLSLNETRVILAAISKIKKGMVLSSDQPLVITCDDFMETFELGSDYYPRRVFHALVDAVSGLMRNVIKIYNTEEDLADSKKNKYSGSYTEYHWLNSGTSYDAKKREISLRFDDQIIPLISQLESCYTSYELKSVSTMKSAYSIRLYQLLIQWRSVGFKKFSVREIRTLLDIEDHEYTTMSNFKKRVIDLAVLEINATSDIFIANPKQKTKSDSLYEQTREGREISHFTFRFREKKQAIEAAKPKNEPKKLGVAEVEVKPIQGAIVWVSGETYLLKAIAENYPEITKEYVERFASDNDIDIMGALLQIKKDYESPGEFSLKVS